MSISVIGQSWCGSAALKNLVIFGDSYCAVGYGPTHPHPSLEQPLGIEFPGTTYNEPDLPNWVGHFIAEYSPNPDLLAYDYAVGGAMVSGVETQVLKHFLRHVGPKPEWAPWTAQDTLFVTWIGINDCAFTNDFTDKMTTLIALQEALYANGARNFLFVDVPPMNRSPAAKNARTDVGSRVHKWNTSLREMISEFTAAHSDVTALVFSSWDLFTRVLDDPAAHGFPKDDVQKFGGSIWVDHIHPSTKMHDIIAKDFSSFLDGWPAFFQPST